VENVLKGSNYDKNVTLKYHPVLRRFDIVFEDQSGNQISVNFEDNYPYMQIKPKNTSGFRYSEVQDVKSAEKRIDDTDSHLVDTSVK